ncbi:hypothetical protein NMG60_11000178 [Bertholletia excelsa]
MGLDSLPDHNWVPRERNTLESIFRSRSVNSVDFFPEFNPTSGLHRRVRTSVSFREVPTFLQQEKHDFFVLCFEKVAGSKKMCLSVRESEVGLEEQKQRKAEEERKRKDLRERKPEKKKASVRKEEQVGVRGKCSSKLDYNVHFQRKKMGVDRQPRASLKARNEGKPVNCKKASAELKIVREKRKKSQPAAKKVPSSCPSENSDRVSVHNLHRYPSPDEWTWTITSTNPENPCSSSRRSFISDEHALKAKRSNRDEKAAKETRETHCSYVDLLDHICSLTDEEIIKQSGWAPTKVANFEHVEEICSEFGKELLDLLLHQLVDELVACEVSCFSL